MSKPTKAGSPVSGQAGISLIEVLVALVVIAIGLLGVVGLQLTGVQGNYLSYQYLQASASAQSLSDLMQGNKAAVLDGDYLLAAGTVPATPATNCLETACSPRDQAIWDLAVAYRTISGHDFGAAIPDLGPVGVLSGAALSVLCSGACGDDDARLITIYWDSDRGGADGYGCDPNNDEDLKCFRLPHNP